MVNVDEFAAPAAGQINAWLLLELSASPYSVPFNNNFLL